MFSFLSNEKQRPFLKRFLHLLFLLAAARIIEAAGLVLIQKPACAISAPLVRGLLTDWGLLSLLTLLFLLISIPFKTKAATFISQLYFVLSLLLYVLYFLDILYFIYTAVPIDHSLFILDFKELKQTVAFSVNNLYLLLSALAILLALLFFVSVFLTKRILPLLENRHNFLPVFALILTGLYFFVKPSRADFDRDIKYFIAENKLKYFAGSVADYYRGNDFYDKNKFTGEELEEFRVDLGFSHYCGKEFPALHCDSGEDVLSPFFKSDSRPPNIVFIACESLSAAFSGDSSYFGSFTPFLDSLAAEGLYWPNCISTTERTFGVLPAILGSLPLARKGFASLAGNYPKHLTLMSLLKKNGYFVSYFHGGPLGFDKFYDFVKYQQPDYIFGTEKNKPVADDAENKKVSWGMYDDRLFSRAMKIINTQNTAGKPRFDVFLTLTTHAPFNIPRRDFWERKFDERLRDLKSPRRERAVKQKFRLSAFLYLDNALRQFIKAYSRRPDFANTIFVITGDHRMGTPAENPLAKYHVPLVIYSPMLQRHATFEAVVSHSALPPSFSLFLKNSYGLMIPDSLPWMTGALDTVRDFENVFSYPFMRNSRVVNEYIRKEYFLSGDRLYKILRGLNLALVNNDSLKNLLKEDMERYMQFNYYMCFNDRLFPYRILPERGKRKNILTSAHSVLTIDSSAEYISVMPADIKIKKGYSRIYVDMKVSFKNVKVPPENFPRLVINLQNGKKENLMWKAIIPDGTNKGSLVFRPTNRAEIMQVVDLKRYNAGDSSLLKIYLWNIHKTSMRFQDVKIKVDALMTAEEEQ